MIKIVVFLGIYEIIQILIQNWHVNSGQEKIQISEKHLTPRVREIFYNLKNAIKKCEKNDGDLITSSIMEDFIKVKQESYINSEIAIKQLIDAIASKSINLSSHSLLEISRQICINFPVQRKPIIFVDISGIVAHNAKYISGVQRVTISILREFFLNFQDEFDIKPVYAALCEYGYLEANNLSRDFFNINTENHDDVIIDPQAGDIFLGLDLSRKEIINKATYLKQLHSEGVKFYFVVYDLLAIQHPEFWPVKLKNDQIHLQWLNTICQFDGFACISKVVASDLSSWYEKNKINGISQLKIDWFHMGADVKNSIISKELPSDYVKILDILKAKPTFLLVGTIEPRKGYAQVLEAFDVLWQKNYDFNLVFVGKEGWLVKCLIKKILRHQQLDKRLFWLSNVSDEYLEKIYDSSVCLIAASYAEGFGLPLIEAAQHATPIIARDIPIFREVAADNAFYFTASNDRDLADQIIQWFKMYSDNCAPVSKNMHFLTWKQSAVRLFEIITAK